MAKRLKAIAVKIGDKIGCMVALKNARTATIDCMFQCGVCGAKKTTSATNLRTGMYANRKSTGCVNCNARIRFETTGHTTNYANRQPVPVMEGEVAGKMIAVHDMPTRSTKGEYRCAECGEIRAMRFSEAIRKGCSICRKRKREPIIAERRKIARDAKYASLKTLFPWKHFARIGRTCLHKKELICVDPGGVRIMRCRVCDVVPVPAWQPPRIGNLFPRPALDCHRDECDPGFENAVRLIEDCG